MRGMVFTQIFRRLTYCLFAGLLVSCVSYRSLQIETLQPAKISLEQGARIAILNRNIVAKDNPATFLNAYEEVSLENLFLQFAHGMRDVFQSTGHFNTLRVLGQQEVTLLSGHTPPQPFITDTIRAFCDKFEIDYIATVELQYYTSSHSGSDLCNNWFVRLYSPALSVPIDSILLRDELNPIADEQDDLLDRILIGSWDKGAEYAGRISPSWATGVRRVYRQEKVLRLGDAFLQEENIEEALKVWEGAMLISDKTAIKAAINMAWVYENAGNFEEATGILQRALQIANEKGIYDATVDYLQKYIQVIKLRIENAGILDQQMPPEI